MAEIRHFLTLRDFSSKELNTLIQRAIELKQAWKGGSRSYLKKPNTGNDL